MKTWIPVFYLFARYAVLFFGFANSIANSDRIDISLLCIMAVMWADVYFINSIESRTTKKKRKS